jgi:hypothetical protein
MLPAVQLVRTRGGARGHICIQQGDNARAQRRVSDASDPYYAGSSTVAICAACFAVSGPSGAVMRHAE